MHVHLNQKKLQIIFKERIKFMLYHCGVRLEFVIAVVRTRSPRFVISTRNFIYSRQIIYQTKKSLSASQNTSQIMLEILQFQIWNS